MLNVTDSIIKFSSQNVVLRDTYRLLSATLIWSALTASLGMLFPPQGLALLGIFVLSIALLFAMRAYRNSATGVLLVFGFTGLMGYSLGPTLNHYLAMSRGSETVGLALAATGGAFFGLSAYVQVSKRDFGFMHGFLMAGLLGLVILSLVGVFMPVSGLSLVLAFASVLLFSGFILLNTSDILTGRQTNYVMATIDLYLDIFNMFVSMLRIFGKD